MRNTAAERIRWTNDRNVHNVEVYLDFGLNEYLLRQRELNPKSGILWLNLQSPIP